MDLAKTLIRSVVRAFYDKRQVLIIDALLVHSAYEKIPSRYRYLLSISLRLPNDELAILMGMQGKELRKACGKLREDKMMVS